MFSRRPSPSATPRTMWRVNDGSEKPKWALADDPVTVSGETATRATHPIAKRTGQTAIAPSQTTFPITTPIVTVFHRGRSARSTAVHTHVIGDHALWRMVDALQNALGLGHSRRSAQRSPRSAVSKSGTHWITDLGVRRRPRPASPSSRRPGRVRRRASRSRRTSVSRDVGRGERARAAGRSVLCAFRRGVNELRCRRLAVRSGRRVVSSRRDAAHRARSTVASDLRSVGRARSTVASFVDTVACKGSTVASFLDTVACKGITGAS